MEQSSGSDAPSRDHRTVPIIGMTMRAWAWAQTTRPFRAFSRFTDVGGSVLSAGMSFQAVFAVFAALWVGFGVLALSIRDNTELLEMITEQINFYVPGLLGPPGEGAVSLTTLLSRDGVTTGSLIAAVSLVWVMLTWFTGTRRAVRLIFGLEVKQYKNPVLLKIRDLVMAALFFAAILVSAVLTIVSSGIFTWLAELLGVDPDSWIVGTVGALTRYGVMYAVDVLILMAIHRILAEVVVPLRPLLFGCLLGGGALFGLKILADVLVGGASSNPLLASFAVIVGLLLWFNLICRALLLSSAWIATGMDPQLGRVASL